MTKERVEELLKNSKATIDIEIDDAIVGRCWQEAAKIDVSVDDYISALVIQNLRLDIGKSS
jgi:hypothetical protein